ncbi:hypothetical protein EYF80_019585 [Liparis tanakae]|uniref:Uncharacterized protein n=1 Tax=Liparis tanakae TaxID=230148 RepID=A0A4Z2HYY7_9TELE|nr:hypothetical protein EYF80_019585 [Liparis tanakae]
MKRFQATEKKKRGKVTAILLNYTPPGGQHSLCVTAEFSRVGGRTIQPSDLQLLVDTSMAKKDRWRGKVKERGGLNRSMASFLENARPGERPERPRKELLKKNPGRNLRECHNKEKAMICSGTQGEVSMLRDEDGFQILHLYWEFIFRRWGNGPSPPSVYKCYSVVQLGAIVVLLMVKVPYKHKM